MLQSKMPTPPATPATSAKPITARFPFHVMTKPTGWVCNLDCTYCFYLEKERLYEGENRGGTRMKPEVLEAYVRGYIESQPGSEVSFAWQGGEPTLCGVEFFEKAMELQQRHGKGRNITNAFQTNGTLLNDKWGEFLAKHKFLVGISVDGPRHIHDGYRVDKGQRPTFDRVMNGVDVLKRHKVEFNTLTTVHRKNMYNPLDVYRFLREIGSGYIQFIPIVERAAEATAASASGLWLAPPPGHPESADLDSVVTQWSVRPADYGNFLCAIFDEWIKTDVGRVFVQQFDCALANWAGEFPGVCVFSEKCGRALAVEHNGDVFTCDHYVYPHYKLGNIMTGNFAAMVESPAQVAFGDSKLDGLPQYCRKCPVQFACHGDCPKHRFMKTPDGEDGLAYLCAGYKKFYTHIDSPMRTMTSLLRQGRAPAEIMRIPREQWMRGVKLK